MMEIRAMQAGEALPSSFDARVLCSEEVSVQIRRSGFCLDYLPAASAEWRSFPVSEEAERAQMSGGKRCHRFGAFAGEHLAGQAVLLLTRDRWGEVLDIRVELESRRLGIGRSLMETCIRAAEQNGMAGLRIEVPDTDPAACQFCEHMGFVLQGIDRLRYAESDRERLKPLMRRACALIFYRKSQKG